MNASKISSALGIYVIGGLLGAALAAYGLHVGNAMYSAVGTVATALSQIYGLCSIAMTIGHALDAIQGTASPTDDESPTPKRGSTASGYKGRALGKPEL